jgi:DNA (cytosine-5)-methyltransferase 1
VLRTGCGLRELALFAGAGGGILGGHLLGWQTVCAVECDPYAASVLVARQNEGILPPFPIWDDVQTFDGRPWRGIVDVVSGGFPCTDISAAGKGAGITGEQSGLWSEMARIVCEVRPRYVFVENSPVLTSRGLDRVLGDLAALGFDARWGVLGAADLGAPHQRDRIWIVAYSNGEWELQPQGLEQNQRGWISDGSEQMAYPTSEQRRGKPQQPERAGQTTPDQPCRCSDAMADSNSCGQSGQQRKAETRETGAISGCCLQMGNSDSERLQTARSQSAGTNGEHSGRSFVAPSWWVTEPDVGRVAHGVAARVDRLKAIGNGQVPAVAAAAFRRLVLPRDTS